MNFDSLLAAGLFMLVSSITPGPNNTMLLASGVHFGLRRTVPHVLGVQMGFFLMLVSVGLGLHTLLQALPWFYDALRYAGAAYMLWMAWKLATAHWGRSDIPNPLRPMGFWPAVGFQWVNPKAVVMAVTFMTTYVPHGVNTAQILLWSSLYFFIGLPSSTTWIVFGQGMRSFLQDPLRLRVFNCSMALALVASLYPLLATN